MTVETMPHDAMNGAAEMPAGAPDTRGVTVAATGADSAASGPTGAVWDALTGNPGATVTVIATAAGVSKNRARKALTELEADGRVVRTAGGHEGGKRAPDTWNPVPQTTDDATETDTDTDTDTGGAAGDDEDAKPSPSVVTTVEATPDAEGMDAAVVAEAHEVLAALSTQIAAALEALGSEDRSAALAAAEGIYAGSGKARRLVRTAASGRPRSPATGRLRSHPGELRAKVVAHLTEHRGKEFTPHEIGKAINHSAGAVANALDRLVELEQAVVTCDRPRRFTAIPTSPAADVPDGVAGKDVEAASDEHSTSDSAGTDSDTAAETGDDARQPKS